MSLSVLDTSLPMQRSHDTLALDIFLLITGLSYSYHPRQIPSKAERMFKYGKIM